jgi:hypothetical protein
MMQTIKTLILEFVAGNGPGHIREIHLQVAEFRPEVPQHTVRARLSEMSRSESLEEKLKSFGKGSMAFMKKIRKCAVWCPIPTGGHGVIRDTGVIVRAIWSKTLF